jgi:flagellar biosynthetic protein FlhB
MSESQGDKTEQPTQRRLEDAWKKGEFARSAEMQTIFVMLGGLFAIVFTGQEMWRLLGNTMIGIFSHLHQTPLTQDAMQSYAIKSMMVVSAVLWPATMATAVAGLLAGGIQTRFRATPEALGIHWERLNPAAGFQRVFSMRAAVPTGVGILKLITISLLSWGVIKSVLADPIFYSSVDVARIAVFLADASFRIIIRIAFALGVIGGLEYVYQAWRTHQDLKMTKEELKEESKSQEGNSQVKSRQRSRRKGITQRKMLAEIPKADVVVTNPTHLAIALRYDRKTMKAPKIVAKGSRLNALRIREIARQHQVPIIENKPLARMMFKYGKVGGEVPAQLYSAVAEILAYVYRINAYRYYREQSTQ